MFKDDYPIPSDGELRRLPRAGPIRSNVPDRYFGSVTRIEEESLVRGRLEPVEHRFPPKARRIGHDGFAGNLAGKALPIIFFAPAWLDELRPWLKLPPGVAAKQLVAKAELSRAGQLRSDLPGWTSP